jgi:uncharacterized membrane protein YkvA (DUF1232 family)
MPTATPLDTWKERARSLKADVHALALALHDPRTPRRARVLAFLLVAYAMSPIDLIPDFIPVLGYVDDLVVLPIGVRYVVRLIPPDVLADCRQQVDAGQRTRPGRTPLVGAIMVVTVWSLIVVLIAVLIWRPEVAE